MTDLMQTILQGNAESFKAGMDASPSKRALQAVVAAYDKAKLDEETKLPTYLMLALEMARQSC